MIKSIKYMALASSILCAPLAAEASNPATLNKVSGAELVTPHAGGMSIEINKGTLVRLDRPASEVFIANPEIADVQVKSARVVYIFGKAQGETTFYALDEQDNTIFSSGIAVTRNLSALNKAFERMMPGSPISATTLGELIVLQGNVGAPDQAALAEQLAKSVLGTDQVMNNINVLQPTQVNLRVRIAEVSRTVLKQLGVSWEGFLSGSGAGIGIATGRNVFDLVPDPVTGIPSKVFIPGADTGSLLGTITPGNLDLNYAIDALDREGFLTVLAEPNLTALTGQAANFLAGGEFPIPIPSRDGIGIEYREFGVKLDFTPTVLNSGRISMQVRPEVSDLSDAGAIRINGISVPSISTRRAETTIELGSGQSFAIAGLIENSVSQDKDKYPGLGDIPIIGALFRSDRFRREETELLIVVTPYLVKPVSNRHINLPTDNFIAPNDVNRILNGKSWEGSTQNTIANQDNRTGASLKQRAGFQLD